MHDREEAILVVVSVARVAAIADSVEVIPSWVSHEWRFALGR